MPILPNGSNGAINLSPSMPDRGRTATGGAALDVCLTFDNMGSAADVGRGKRFDQDPGDPSLLIGYPRILDLLERLDLRGTFFVEGWNALHNPQHVRRIAEAGHEVAVHGWAHERFAELSIMEASRCLADSIAAFRQIGIEPEGFRAPGGLRNEGLVALLEQLGLRYDSSIGTTTDPMQLTWLSASIPNIPWHWEMIDYWHYFMSSDAPRSPQALVDAFRSLVAKARANEEILTLVFHPHVSGTDDQRFEALAHVLTEISTDPGIRVWTGAEMAAAFARRPLRREGANGASK